MVNVSTVSAHNFATANFMLAYGLTKNGGTLAMQLVAQDTKPEVMQIVTFNPGPVFTPAAESAGYKPGDFDFSDRKMPSPLSHLIFLPSPFSPLPSPSPPSLGSFLSLSRDGQGGLITDTLV